MDVGTASSNCRMLLFQASFCRAGAELLSGLCSAQESCAAAGGPEPERFQGKTRATLPRPTGQKSSGKGGDWGKIRQNKRTVSAKAAV